MRRGAAAACLALALLATGGDCSVRLAKPRLSRVARVRVLGAAPPIDESRVAVVLNANARRVGAREIALARELVGAEHVFATRCDEEAKAAYTQIVARGYGTVVPAGGDGTLCAVINGLANERRDAWGEVLPLVGMPRFAYLPLGTGNGMATLVGPRQNMAEATLPVPLIEVDGGDLCFFAGCGFDSLMLDDFR
ncbi:ATP-NAD kinase-like domain-containing protein, partial [Pavlovales sp. CCMP2436]